MDLVHVLVSRVLPQIYCFIYSTVLLCGNYILDMLMFIGDFDGQHCSNSTARIATASFINAHSNMLCSCQPHKCRVSLAWGREVVDL